MQQPPQERPKNGPHGPVEQAPPIPFRNTVDYNPDALSTAFPPAGILQQRANLQILNAFKFRKFSEKAEAMNNIEKWKLDLSAERVHIEYQLRIDNVDWYRLPLSYLENLQACKHRMRLVKAGFIDGDPKMER